MWFSRSHFKPAGKTALVVGASQGVGADIALRLYQQGCSVILVARTEARLQQQVTRIRATAPPGKQDRTAALAALAAPATVSYRVCDVADYGACEQMWHALMAMGSADPDFVFCCAGLSVPKLFGDLTGAELAAGMATNYLTAANTVHAGHRAVLRKHADTAPAAFKPRHVVLFSSTVAAFPFIGYAQYAPSKAALLALATVLRQELVVYNYRVSCVFPGNFASEGYAEEQKTKPAITKKIEGPSAAIPSLQCCDIVLDRLAKGYDSIYTDLIGWALASSTLGVSPRCWGFFQVLVSLLFLVFSPIAMLFIYLDIKASFKQTAVPADLADPADPADPAAAAKDASSETSGDSETS